jgi:hypothetical protein
MRALLILCIFVLCRVIISYCQTTIPATTTIQQISNMPKGIYVFTAKGLNGAPDTLVDFNKDTIPPCPVCPLCPPPPKQRTTNGLIWSQINKGWQILYDDGTSSNL